MLSQQIGYLEHSEYLVIPVLSMEFIQSLALSTNHLCAIPGYGHGVSGTFEIIHTHCDQ